jgi:hypothetical protein
VERDGVLEGHAFGCIICVDITDIWVGGSMAPCVTISNGNYLHWEGLERTKPRLHFQTLLSILFHALDLYVDLPQTSRTSSSSCPGKAD